MAPVIWGVELPWKLSELQGACAHVLASQIAIPAVDPVVGAVNVRVPPPLKSNGTLLEAELATTIVTPVPLSALLELKEPLMM